MRIARDTRDFARRLRREQTDAERRLWRHLRDRRLLNTRFRRQHPIGPYFADFVCLELRLVIELDGGQHTTQAGRYHDAVRSRVLAGYGFEILRFWDNAVLRDVHSVLAAIAVRIAARRQTLTPTLSRERERG